MRVEKEQKVDGQKEQKVYGLFILASNSLYIYIYISLSLSLSRTTCYLDP